jgi:GT2 family glycosyltransferase
MRVANLTAAIATLNRSDDLMRCLDALLSGDVLPAEILIVDQSQGDATRLAVERRQDSPIPIIYIRQEGRGLSASRNMAIGRASRPIVAVTDDDCVPDKGWIAAIDRAFASQPAPAAVTGSVRALGPDLAGLYAVSLREGTARAEFSGKVLPWIIGTGGNFAVRRDWLDLVGHYDERLGAGSPGQAAEDAELLYRLLCSGARIRYEPDALIYHERQSRTRRMRSRWTYGHGIGAFCGIYLRRRDPYALRILAYWLLGQIQGLVRGVRRLEPVEVKERLLILRGTVCGLAYGMRLR